MSAMVSQITGVPIVCSTVGSGADKKIKAPRHWPLCGWMHWWPVNSPYKKASDAKNVFIWWRHPSLVQIMAWSETEAVDESLSIRVPGKKYKWNCRFDKRLNHFLSIKFHLKCLQFSQFLLAPMCQTHIITHPCPHCNGGLPPFRLGMGEKLHVPDSKQDTHMIYFPSGFL